MAPAGSPSPLARGFRVPGHLRAALLAVSALGGLSFLLGLFVAPDRAWGGFLMGFVLLAGLALAGPVFLALTALAGARWPAVLQRVPEAMGMALPAAAVAGLVLLFGTHDLYEWSHPGAVAQDALLQHKAAWLNPAGFAVRVVVVFALWILLARRLVVVWRRFVETGERDRAASLVATSALFIAVVAITYTVAICDWLMSLEPHWFSTMFPLMHFGGLAAAGLAAAILVVLLAERQGALRGLVREEHLHDLGKLLFGLTLFWGYCWYCQYMLVWYTDMPEETAHYVARKQGGWWLLVQAALVLKWGVPFVALMARRACRSRKVLGNVAAAVLVGHALDLYVQVGPPLMGAAPVLGAWELGPVLGAAALFFLLCGRALERGDVVQAGHPHLAESLSYQTP